MKTSERIALLDKVILAVRPQGFLAETVLVPIQTLRDDLAAEAKADEVTRPEVEAEVKAAPEAEAEAVKPTPAPAPSADTPKAPVVPKAADSKPA